MQAINVLVERVPDVRPHWIQYDINSLASGQLCSRHEVAVARHQHDLLNHALQSEGSNINPDSCVNAFLGDVESRVGPL